MGGPLSRGGGQERREEQTETDKRSSSDLVSINHFCAHSGVLQRCLCVDYSFLPFFSWKKFTFSFLNISSSCCGFDL